MKLLDVMYNEDKMRTGMLQLKNYLETAVNQYGNATTLLSIKVTLENHIARVLDGLTVVQ